MKWIGLTGGIATGKTTVAKIFAKSGYPIVDADMIAREVVQAGTEGFDKIVKTFGRTIVQEDGQLNRAELGKIIFSDLEKRLTLEKIIHPLVQKRTAQLRHELEMKGVKLAFYDVPLLYEKNLEDNFDAVVVVASSGQIQLDRLMSRDHLTKAQAAERIAAQMSVNEKASRANYVIWNDGSLNDLNYQAMECLNKLKRTYGV